MTESKPTRAHLAPAGLMFLAITSVGWGFNWPVTKYLLGELPPLTLRGSTGVVGAALLAALALVRGQSLLVGREMWLRLALAALLNVTGWMVLMGLALLWLPASETALIAYTMPVWASILAWPVLGERPTLLRTIALVMAFAGLGTIMGGNSFSANAEKLPGILMALAGSFGFALGTALERVTRLGGGWQIGLGCFPVALVGHCRYRTLAAPTPGGARDRHDVLASRRRAARAAPDRGAGFQALGRRCWHRDRRSPRPLGGKGQIQARLASGVRLGALPKPWSRHLPFSACRPIQRAVLA
jgi:uncharacterized membrane protein